jgi:2-polyprenyl-3-methyl-5-hydroxy-6-metoxy-1,4-benzoquinol methylase
VQLNDAQQRLTAQQVAVEQVQHDVAAAGRRGQSHLAESELRLLRLERDLRKYAGSSPRPAIPQPDSTPPQQSTGAPDLPFDYFLFEHRFRGSIEDIKHRQEAYLEYFAHAESVIDLGCGRGEFVELMVERDIPVIGVDLNEDMIDFCKARGLPVLKRDLFEFLTAQSDGSLGSIFVSQVVEHLPPERVWKLIQLAAAKLKTDGVLLLETINPQCFAAMSCFYLDPSHVRPYHAALLAFMCEQAGLKLECMQFSAPLASATTGPILKSSEHIPPAEAVHYQDYAVLARRTSLSR